MTCPTVRLLAHSYCEQIRYIDAPIKLTGATSHEVLCADIASNPASRVVIWWIFYE